MRATNVTLSPAPAASGAAAHCAWLWPVALILLWAAQLRYPPLSYPAGGTLLVTALGALVLLAAMQGLRTRAAWRFSAPVLLPGGVFLLWTVARWGFAGFPHQAADDVMTWCWAALYLLLALFAGTPRPGAPPLDLATPPLLPAFVKAVSIAGLACGLYAIAQYHWIYEANFQTYLASLEGAAPDRTQAAMLHHLKLRRVASFLGDPNIYAALAAMAVAASLEVFASSQRRRLFWKTTALLSIAASLLGIVYSGSRGGMLDGLLVAGAAGGLWLWNHRHRRRRFSGAAVVLLAAILFSSRIGTAQQTTDTAAATLSTIEAQGPASAWIWRSDTIRERLYYLDVGAKMIAKAPLVGLGPGSVGTYFGQFKNPAAREARNLHNWPAHIWAEYGAIGLGLLGWFLGALIWRCLKGRIWERPWLRTIFLLYLLMLFDGLLQTSWGNRELMSTFGLICGALLSAPVGDPPAKASRLSTSVALIAAAIAIFTLVIEIPYLTARSKKQLADDAMAAQDYVAVSRYLQAAERWAPRDSEIYQSRAHLALLRGDTTAARQFYEKALAINPKSAALHGQLAAVYEAIGDTAREKTHIQQALELYPSLPRYNMQYAAFLRSANNDAEALAYARRARAYAYEPSEIAAIDQFINELQNQPHANP